MVMFLKIILCVFWVKGDLRITKSEASSAITRAVPTAASGFGCT